jgi:pyrroline-5-carboxylate reductase
MAEAMIRGLLKVGLVRPDALMASDIRLDHLEEIGQRHGIQTLSDNPLLVKQSDVVILSVKPQSMAGVLKEIAPVSAGKLFISIAAGTSTSSIRAHLPKQARLIRVMPNTPALVLEGITAIASAEGLEAEDLETAKAIFSAIGRVVVLDERLLDVVTGLSGSGPAYIAMVVEALADGGVNMGLDRQTAMTLAVQTLFGTAKLLIETGMHPAQLKDMVASPGGTTIAGISALEEGGLRRALIMAVERATRRSRELGQGGTSAPS